MPSRTLPGLGLKGDWALGEDDWKDENDLNLLTLSVLTQGRVLSILAATPGAPAEGAVHIFDATHPTNANAIAIYDEATWKYIAAVEGMVMFNVADSKRYEFKAGAWTEAVLSVVTAVATAASDLLAADVGKYLRFTDAAAKTLTVRPNATHALPANGEWHIRNVGLADLTITPGVGVTINPPNGGSLVVPQGGTVTLKRVAVNEFDLLGQTVAA